MPLRVTFDTNVLDLACRPERFPNDPRQPHLWKVHDALKAQSIQGFYSVTMLTIEGIMKKDRAGVFSNTTVKHQPEKHSITKNTDLPEVIREKVGAADLTTLDINLVVNQPRKPLHPEVIARIEAANALSVRVLKAVPRIGAYQITDPNGERYLSNGEGDALRVWIDTIHDVARAVEGRGVGIAQVKALGSAMTADSAEMWFQALENAKDVHQERAVERAFAEWADGDSIAAHIAYGLDIFCSADVGNSNATNSILDADNRAWLTQTYGVRFMNFDELLAALP